MITKGGSMLNEAIKNRIILVLGILCVILFFWAVGATRGFLKQKGLSQEEIRTRLEVEEENINLSKERSLLSAKAKQLGLDLQKQATEYQQTKDLLEKQRKESDRLREEMERLSRFKQALEENLKDALMKKANPAAIPAATAEEGVAPEQQGE
ncbi:MAG: hypothetical protein ACE5GG_00560 [Candidatus Omnitrophota bacterium]